MTTSNEVAAILADTSNVLIVTHVRPDGDAVGSALGLQNALIESGRKADVYFEAELPNAYDGYIPSNMYIGDDLPTMAEYSHVVAVDTSNADRLGCGNAFELKSLEIPLVNIDHHLDNGMFGSVNYIAESASTAELVQKIITEIDGCTISPKTATLLMFGMIADTGAFRYDNTTPVTLTNASELLAAGAEHHVVINRLFFSKPLNYAQFEADLLVNHLKTACDGRFAWFFIDPELITKYDVDLKNAEGLIEILRQLDGTDIVAIITRQPERHKISLRSKDQAYSVGAIARQLNGGGHEMAAGCSVETDDLTVAEKTLLDLVKTTLGY